MLYSFFWVILWRLNFICQHFGTLSVPSSWAGRYEDGTVCSETLAYEIQMLVNHPEENIHQGTLIYIVTMET
jgi:hypothetical protein